MSCNSNIHKITAITPSDTAVNITVSNSTDIGTLNKEFIDLTGFNAPVVKHIKKILLKQIEKCNRMVYRYKSIGSEATGLHDLHMYDDELHKKLKKKEVENYARN